MVNVPMRLVFVAFLIQVGIYTHLLSVIMIGKAVEWLSQRVFAWKEK